MANYAKLALYASGLLAVGYLAFMVTADVMWTGAIVLIARWLRPYQG